MKKIVILTIVLVLLLSGCGNGGGSKNKLSFWAYEPQSMEDKDLLDNLVKQFEEENDITISVTYIPKDSFNTKLNSSIAVEKNPDISYLDQPLIAKFANDEILLDVTELIDNQSDYFPGALETNVVNGKLYGLPMNMTTVALFYNKDLVSEAPTTWAEWLEIAEEIYIKDEIAAFEGIGGGGWGAWLLPAIVHSGGGSMVNADETEVTFANEAGIEAISTLVELQNYSDQSVRDSQNAFGNGLIAFKISGPWEIGGFQTNFPNLNFGVALIPSIDGKSSASNIGGENIVAYQNTANPEMAAKFIQFLTNEENSHVMAAVTGNFPANSLAAQDEKYSQDEYLSVFMEQMNTSVARPRLNDWLKVNDEVIGSALDEIFVGRAEVKATLENAETRANSILFSE